VNLDAFPGRLAHGTGRLLAAAVAPSARSRQRHGMRLARELEQHERSHPPRGAPVLFFDASARLGALSHNAAFSLLAGWSLRYAGIPVVRLACAGGLWPCVLGAATRRRGRPSPCPSCVAQSRRIHCGTDLRWLPPTSAAMPSALRDASVATLAAYEDGGIPLGGMVLPSVRWALRRHHLDDDPPNRALLATAIAAAARFAGQARELLAQVQPRAVVAFNGTQFPEAILRRLATDAGVPVATHEVGYTPCSAFFSHGVATTREVQIPETFSLGPDDEARLDAQLARRFKGDFTMAGVRFWPQIAALPAALRERASRHDRVVAVFTNVAFDTSQVHANTIFTDMFDWLDAVHRIAARNPRTLFVLRAHPDESRPGRESRETLRAWARQSGADRLANVMVIAPTDPTSSYDLATCAAFVMVYNSTIALEAVMLGKPVLCGGAARYTPFGIGVTPTTIAEFSETARRLLAGDIGGANADGKARARRFLYFQDFRASIPFDAWLAEDPRRPGEVLIRDVPLASLDPSASDALGRLHGGILDGTSFSSTGDFE